MSMVLPAVAGCMALAVVLRAPYVSVPLGVDEGGIAAIARQWPGAHGSLYGASWLDRPPLLVLVYKLAVLGGPLGVRALGALAAAALVAVVAVLGRVLGGPRTAVTAAAIAAMLTGSSALAAVYTPAELLAVVPSAASVLCLLAGHRRRQLGWLVAAGLLAVAAALIKQSFLDAGLAGAVYLVASSLADRRVRWGALTAYAGGAAVPVAATVAWQLAAHAPGRGLAYALFGFRVAGLHTLEGSSHPLLARLQGLEQPAVRSGLDAALAATPVGLVCVRHDRVVLATLCAWFAGGMVGVAGGGSYWPHYLIQLVPVTSVASALLLTAGPDVLRRGLVLCAAVAALVAAGASVSSVQAHLPHESSRAVGRYLRDHARPSDTQYVLYARANVGYYSGLPSPYPYAWSLMVRAIPGAPAQLRRLLASPRRPTWVVRWQPPSAWGLDPRHRTQRLLREHYVRVASVGRHAILLRRDVARHRGIAPAPRAPASSSTTRGQAPRPSASPWR
jgi:hypothetical protein